MQTFGINGPATLPVMALALPHNYHSSGSLDIDSAQRRQWVSAFGRRMAALRPEHESREALVLAESLWEDLSHYDPEIAAEMEFEGGLDA